MKDISPVSVETFVRKLRSCLAGRPVTRERIAVAVSGGADSMALCTLLSEHRKKKGWPKTVFAYTLDHKVRPESTSEAHTVGQWVKMMGFRHRILELPPLVQKKLQDSTPSDLETVLGTSRRAVLSRQADKDAIDTLLTGHHQDDQYETIVQRLAFGSTLAGLGGISTGNGLFVRPLLTYPKARLRATCEYYNTPSVDDPTNFEPTYALRNAIRHIVRNQDDLPLALKRSQMLILSSYGDRFRTDVIGQVNHLLGLCSFARETFTGRLKVKCPPEVHKKPIRVLRHFIPALARVFRSNKIDKFELYGIVADLVSASIVNILLDPKDLKFNIQGLSFEKVEAKSSGAFTLLIAPDALRRRLTEKRHRIVFGPEDADGWRHVICKEWMPPWTFKISVKDDLGYYIRALNKKDMITHQKWIPEHSRIIFENGLWRAQKYAKSLFPVLCHHKGHLEYKDALPRFGIDISSDVRTSCIGAYGDFDLGTGNAQWVELEKGNGENIL